MKKLRNQILTATNNTCYWCGFVGSKSEFDADHITPKSLGGIDDVSNLVPACISCNRSRGNKSVERSSEWIERSRYVRMTPDELFLDMMATMQKVRNRIA